MDEEAAHIAEALARRNKYRAPEADLRPPMASPVIAGLFGDDPVEQVLNGLLTVLDPGEWWEETESGFWWTPYRLRHEFTIEPYKPYEHWTGEAQISLRLDVVLVEDVQHEDRALVAVTNLNRSTPGFTVRYDPETLQVIAGARCHVSQQSWWLLFVFLSAYFVSIGILERLAPRLARVLQGTEPCVSHPVHGVREQPDHLVEEHLLSTEYPQTGAGWGLPDDFSPDFARCRQALLADIEREEIADLIDPDDVPNDQTSTQSFGVAHDLDWHGRWTSATTAFAFHPELGWGIEDRTTLLAHFDSAGQGGPAGMPNEYSTRLANLVNLVAADDRLAPLQLGGWSAWGNQLHRSTFLPPLVINHLHATGNDLLIMVSKVCNDLMFVGGALDVLDEIEGHVDGVKATPTNEVRWLGLEDNPYYYPILFDDSEIFATIFERGDRRDFQSVHRYAGGIWALPVTELLASWGSICGDQPMVGTLALSLSESTEQFVLVRRTWTPTETIADVLDVFPAAADQSELLAAVRAAVGSLAVPEIEWFEFHAKDELTREAVIAGLKDVAGASDADLMQIGRVISARNFDPPTRLDLAEPKRFPTAPAGDPLKVWFYAVTQPRVIDKTARAAFGLWHQPA